MLNNAVQVQYREGQVERRKRELDKLGGRFEYIGREWLTHGMVNSVVRRKVKEEWHELPPLLANIEEGERPQLISRLAKSLRLSENSNSSYRVIAARILNNRLEGPSQMLSTKRFSTVSEVFFEYISDIAGYSKEQKALFRDFMNKREDLNGSISLPQTFPAVAEWLVQSRIGSQSSKLS
jgi:hypothetical protein